MRAFILAAAAAATAADLPGCDDCQLAIRSGSCCSRDCNWRSLVPPLVNAINGPSSAPVVYQFGIFRGGSFRLLGRTLNVSQIWGFDSFQGLPESTESRGRSSQDNKLGTREWTPGKYKADPRDALRLLR